MSTVSEQVRGRNGWGAEGDRPGRFGMFFIGIWTLFLLEPLHTGWQRRDEVSGWVGIVATLVFGAVYLTIFARRRISLRGGMPHAELVPGLLAIGGAGILAVVVCVALGQDGTATAVYLCVLCAMTLPRYWSLPSAIVVALAFYLTGFLVPGWTPDAGLLLSMLAATVAVWGIQQMLVRNTQLVASEKQNQRLAVSEERNRFARDLHDILGHSLTVITVKAELAQKLMDVDPERARAEIDDLEWLSRDALADVRRAVEGYRELTLPGEILRARTALAAAEIEADLPNSVDDVPSDKRELFAWTIREGVTNVIRHSSATRCTVVLHPDCVEIRDDGVGPAQESVGQGLVGLRERARAIGATVVTRTLEPGFSLSVVLP
ncbi:MAG: histidine kinase [Marmoricola sp.]|nr:histidine kinase [Marmoricola sp.]